MLSCPNRSARLMPTEPSASKKPAVYAESLVSEATSFGVIREAHRPYRAELCTESVLERAR